MALLVVASALGACAGDESTAAEATDAPKLVLQADDLPQGWQAFDVGRQTATDIGSRGVRSGAWKARYRNPSATPGAGLVLVESRADVFADDAAAAEGLERAEAQLATRIPGGNAIPAPELGEEAFAATYAEETAAAGVRYYLVVWRQANVTSSVFVSGFDPLPLADVLALARKQEARVDERLGTVSATSQR